MKKIFLLSLVFLNLGAIGQDIHKLTGDTPSRSKQYKPYTGNDSTLFAETVYSYNNKGKVMKEITNIGQPAAVDSIVKSYNDSNWIVSALHFRNDVLYREKTWVYDIPNKRIDYYYNADTSANLSGSVDSMFHVIYKGVQDFDKVDYSFSSTLTFVDAFVESADVEIRHCDSMFFDSYNKQSSSWNRLATAKYYFNNDEPDSAKFDFDINSLPSEMTDLLNSIKNYPDIPAMVTNIAFNNVAMIFVPTYNGDKLEVLKGNLVMGGIATILNMFSLPVLLPVPGFIALENQYNGELLTETTIAMRFKLDKIPFSYPPFVDTVLTVDIDDYSNGSKQKFGYNASENIVFMSEERSTNGTTWNLDYKNYYFYDNVVTINDMAVKSLEIPAGQTDNVGASINIKAVLENYNNVDYQQVIITAKITDYQGAVIRMVSDTIPSVVVGTSRHTFTEAYIVPNDSLYSIIVYIDAQDSNQNNDTLKVTRKINHNPVGINKVQDLAIDMSQNIPNPANNVALIYYSVPTDGKVVFTIYNVSGQALRTHSEEVKSGKNTLELQTGDLTSGLYFYAMKFNGMQIIRKMNIQR